MDQRQRAEARKARGRHSRETRGQFGGGYEKNSIIQLPPELSQKPWFKVSDEHKNEIDIVEFEITSEWYPKLKARGGGRLGDVGLVPGALDYKFEVPIHQRIGHANANHFCPFDGFGNPCPICEEKFAKLEANGNKWDKTTMNSLLPSWRDFYWLYDYNNPDAGFHPWEAAFTSFEQPMQDELDKQQDELFPWALDSGNTVEFKGREKNIGDGKTYIEPQIPDFFSREPYPESILDETPGFDQFIRFSTYDEIAADQYGLPGVSSTATGVADRSAPPDDSAPRERGRGRSRGDAPSKDADNRCPSGHNFGADCNNTPDCPQCPDADFDKCMVEQDKLLKEGKKASPEPRERSRSREPEKKPEPSAGRTRSRPAPKKDKPSGGRRRRS